MAIRIDRFLCAKGFRISGCSRDGDGWR